MQRDESEFSWKGEPPFDPPTETKKTGDEKTATPANTIAVEDELQTLTGTTEDKGWIQPGAAGDSDQGASGKPHGTFVMTPGYVALFSAKGGYPYNNGYWYTKRKGKQYDAASLFLYQLNLDFPTQANLDASNAVELDFQQSLNGKIFNWAWQIRQPATKSALYKWNKVSGHWESTGLIVPPSVWQAGMVPIICCFRRDGTDTLTYLSLKIAGKEYLTQQYTLKPVIRTESNYMSTGFQLDSNGKDPPTPYQVKVTSFRVVYA